MQTTEKTQRLPKLEEKTRGGQFINGITEAIEDEQFAKLREEIEQLNDDTQALRDRRESLGDVDVSDVATVKFDTYQKRVNSRRRREFEIRQESIALWHRRADLARQAAAAIDDRLAQEEQSLADIREQSSLELIAVGAGPESMPAFPLSKSVAERQFQQSVSNNNSVRPIADRIADLQRKAQSLREDVPASEYRRSREIEALQIFVRRM